MFENIKMDFPILQKDMIYLDSCATSFTPNIVVDAEVEYYKNHRSNISRSNHGFSVISTSLFEKTRSSVARFINSKSDGEIIFTYGTTYGINLLCYSFFMDYIKEGDEIITTELEHHALIIPLQQLAKRKNASLKFLPLKDGFIDMDKAPDVFSKKTRLLALTGMSNITGYCPNIKKLTKIAKVFNCLVLIDGAQLVPHKKIDVADLDIDFLVFSAHKMLGPTGVGVLYAKKELQDKISPFMYGGDMAKYVNKQDSIFLDDHHKFDGGTPNIAGVIAFEKAIEYIENLGINNVSNYIKDISKYAFEKARDFKNINVYSEEESGILTFNIPNIHSHDSASVLDSLNIYVRSGYMCAMPLLEHLGIKSCVRASFYIYNTKKDVDKLFEGLKKVISIFKD